MWLVQSNDAYDLIMVRSITSQTAYSMFSRRLFKRKFWEKKMALRLLFINMYAEQKDPVPQRHAANPVHPLISRMKAILHAS